MTNQSLIIIFLTIIFIVTSCQSDYEKYDTAKETIGETDSNGLKQGTWTAYNSVGEIIRIENFQDDTLHGMIKSYYRNGNIYTKVKYNKGELIDTFLIYYENGQLNSFSWRDSNSVGQDTFKIFYDNGQIKQIGEYKNGKLWGNVIEYNVNGQVESVDIYDEFGLERTSIYFKQNGDTLKIVNYRNDTIVSQIEY